MIGAFADLQAISGLAACWDVPYSTQPIKLVNLITPYFYGRTVNVPPPSLQFHAYENELLTKRLIKKLKL